jgi:uncharacterized RDD family membrane protein YckC
MVSLEDSGKSGAVFTTADLAPAGAAAYAEELRYAGFWMRLAAYVIDIILIDIVVLIGFLPIAVVMAFLESSNGKAEDPGSIGLTINALTVIAIALYYGLFTASKWQATPGKRLLGLYIVGTDGRKLGFGLGIGRYLAYFLSSITMGFGFFMIGWSDQKKGMHDIVCRTRVIHGRPRARDLATVFE